MQCTKFTGIEWAVILIVIFLGSGLIYGLYKDYSVKMRATRKRNPKTGEMEDDYEVDLEKKGLIMA